MSLSSLTLKDIQFATTEEIRQLIDFLHTRGVNMNVYLVLDKEGRPLHAFAFPEHASTYVNSTLQTGLTVAEMKVWWSNLKPPQPEEKS